MSVNKMMSAYQDECAPVCISCGRPASLFIMGAWLCYPCDDAIKHGPYPELRTWEESR